MKLIIRLLIISTTLSLTACGLTSARDKQYLSANSIQPLRIPPGISSSSFHSEYPVSDHYYPEKIKEVSTVPPGLNS